jgi:hypothetical protein
MKRFFCALWLCSLWSALKAQTPSTSPSDANEIAQKLMNIEVAFETMRPAGSSIQVKETSRHGRSGEDLVVSYRIYVKGAPPDPLFQWIQWPVNQEEPSSPLSGITAGMDGLLICAGQKPEQCGDSAKPNDPMDFIVMPRRGEPTRIAFVAGDFKIGTVIMADPISATDRGCTISAVRLASKFELAFITGTGFEPDSDVHYQFSPDQTKERIIHSDSSGVIRVSLTPIRAGEKGTASVKILGPRCSPKLSFDWGTI